MARAFTSEQKALLRSPDLHVNVLATFYLDAGTFRFCDDQAGFDLSDGTNTYIGASALAEAAEIRASQDLSAEQVTLVCDGDRMAQYGIQDPAKVLSDILAYLYQQRRVDYAFGFRYSYSKNINLVIPAYAGKINNIQLVDQPIDYGQGARTTSSLIITLDSLAARYNRVSNRTRSHEDQLEIDPTDNFFSYTTSTVMNERTIYWGKDAPFGATGYNTGIGYGGGVSGGACTAHGSEILLANKKLDGPGKWRRVETLQVDEYVWTQHEATMQWGAFKVVSNRAIESDILRATHHPDLPDASPTHPFWIDGWKPMSDFGMFHKKGLVAHLVIDDAHTYIARRRGAMRGTLSHNKLAQPMELM